MNDIFEKKEIDKDYIKTRKREINKFEKQGIN